MFAQSLPALEGAHSALNTLYQDQLVKAYGEQQQELQQELQQQPKSLMDWPVYKRQYNNIKDNITKKGERSKTVDPQRNTIQDSYSPDDFHKMICAMLEHYSYEGDRMAAMATWGHTMVGRGDDLRLFHVADIIAPQLMPAIGERRGCRLSDWIKPSLTRLHGWMLCRACQLLHPANGAQGRQDQPVRQPSLLRKHPQQAARDVPPAGSGLHVHAPLQHQWRAVPGPPVRLRAGRAVTRLDITNTPRVGCFRLLLAATARSGCQLRCSPARRLAPQRTSATT